MEEDKVKNFKDFSKSIERKIPKVKRDKYSEKGACLGRCVRHIVQDENGNRMVICDSCKRIVNSL